MFGTWSRWFYQARPAGPQRELFSPTPDFRAKNCLIHRHLPLTESATLRLTTRTRQRPFQCTRRTTGTEYFWYNMKDRRRKCTHKRYLPAIVWQLADPAFHHSSSEWRFATKDEQLEIKKRLLSCLIRTLAGSLYRLLGRDKEPFMQVATRVNSMFPTGTCVVPLVDGAG